MAGRTFGLLVTIPSILLSEKPAQRAADSAPGADDLPENLPDDREVILYEPGDECEEQQTKKYGVSVMNGGAQSKGHCQSGDDDRCA